MIRTDAVATRTTLLLVRYRFHLTLPRATGDAQLVAEDARLLGFQGAPGERGLAAADEAAELLDRRPPTRTSTTSVRRAHRDRAPRRLPGADRTPRPSYGDELAADSLASHRRVRGAAGEIVRGLQVTAQQPADVLGVYVYLPLPDAREEAA